MMLKYDITFELKLKAKEKTDSKRESLNLEEIKELQPLNKSPKGKKKQTY